MNKQPNLPTPAESRGHYSVPEGYFDSLEERIMAKIPEETPEEVAEAPRISLWTRLQPHRLSGGDVRRDEPHLPCLRTEDCRG